VVSHVKPSLLDEDYVDVLHEGLVDATTIGLLKISHVRPMLQVLAFSILVGSFHYKKLANS